MYSEEERRRELEDYCIWDYVLKEKARIKKQLLQVWYLSCRDMNIPEGGCSKCLIGMEKECKALRKELFGGEQIGKNVPRR